jgi:23S rRNA (cytidine1920-2'-O)/16S rRNA (cytidine1409-2'-O)-methyltransferase
MAERALRLDVALAERGLVETRAQAGQLIKAGQVELNGQVVTKPAARTTEADRIVLLEPLRYVSRGGLKLEAALAAFRVDVHNQVVLDVGASTGGFTDCLLQHGAARVYAVDVGRDQLAAKLRADPRVQYHEATDIRRLETIPEPIDLVVADLSFISLRLVLPTAARFLNPAGRLIALIKPQFEAGPSATNKQGVIKDPRIRRAVVLALLHWLQMQGWAVTGLIRSPIRGGAGNVEYLADLYPPGTTSLNVDLAQLWQQIEEDDEPGTI